MKIFAKKRKFHKEQQQQNSHTYTKTLYQLEIKELPLPNHVSLSLSPFIVATIPYRCA